MKILVLSKLSIPALNRTIPQWDRARELGHDVTVTDQIEVAKRCDPDVIIAMGVGVLNQTEWAFNHWPTIPKWIMSWDVYEWVWTRPRSGEYDYVKYGGLLRRCDGIFVPSECTGHRLTQWYGVTNWSVVRSCAPVWECGDVRDFGYALCTLREIPDPWWGMFEKCCEEINIPYKTTARDIPRSEYERDVAHCRFIVSPLYELSTGGLSILEAHYHGKPVLMSDSQWHGGVDYLGNRATYFRHGDVDDFKAKLMHMATDPPKHDREECRRFVTDNFSDAVMVDGMLERIESAC